MARGYYSVTLDNVAVTGAISLVQIKAGANSGLEIVRVAIAQSSTTTSTEQRVQIVRKSAAATVTSATPAPMSPNDAAAQAAGGTSATGTNATVEGTDSTVVVSDIFNYLNGWQYLPIPEERPQVIPGGFIAIKFPTAPGSSVTVTCCVVFRELT